MAYCSRYHNPNSVKEWKVCILIWLFVSISLAKIHTPHNPWMAGYCDTEMKQVAYVRLRQMMLE